MPTQKYINMYVCKYFKSIISSGAKQKTKGLTTTIKNRKNNKIDTSTCCCSHIFFL